MHDTLERFLGYLETEKGLSPRTRDAYRLDLGSLVDHLVSEGLEKPEQVNEHHVRAFIARRHRQGLGGRSLQRLLRDSTPPTPNGCWPSRLQTFPVLADTS